MQSNSRGKKKRGEKTRNLKNQQRWGKKKDNWKIKRQRAAIGREGN